MVALAVLVGACVQGLVGLGIGLVATPAAALVAPSLVPGALLWMAILMPLVTLARERDDIDWRGMAWALPPRVPGTVVGALAVAAFDERVLGLTVGVMVLLTVVLTARAVTVPITRPTLIGAGFISGVTGTATSIGGPPLALLYQHRPPAQIRCTLAVYFLAGGVMSLLALGIGGQLVVRDGLVALQLVVPMVLGFWLSRVVGRRLPAHHVRTGVLLICAASALALLVRHLPG